MENRELGTVALVCRGNITQCDTRATAIRMETICQRIIGILNNTVSARVSHTEIPKDEKFYVGKTSY